MQDDRPPPGTFWRHEVDAVVDAGLGRFLKVLFARLTVDHYLDEHEQFVGWEVVRLSDPEFWEGIDLRMGDIVTSVNGHALERDTQAYDAFVSLTVALMPLRNREVQS